MTHINTEIRADENILLEVDVNPIGGFRGNAGALTIRHKDNKIFTDWTENELNCMAFLVQKSLSVYSNAGPKAISNVLLIGKQQEGHFKFSLVPYPKCSAYEKIKGLWDTIFGASSLKEKDIKAIVEYHTKKFKLRVEEGKTELPEKGNDIFCNEAKITHQHIKDSGDCGIYHDNRPKGASKNDPHLMIIPKGKEGHLNTFYDSIDCRFNMLKLAQKIGKTLLQEGHKTLLFIEREGKQLRSVNHTHFHINGIKNFPTTFFKKFFVFLRLLCPTKLSLKSLSDRVEHYKSALKNV